MTTPSRDFVSMLELPPSGDMVPRQSKLAESLYKLSITLRGVDDVRKRLQRFRRWAQLRHYSYAELVDLIHAASNCPPDARLELLKIGGLMVESGNFPDAKTCKVVDKVVVQLYNDKVEFPSLGADQRAARSELKRLHGLFSRHTARPPPSPSAKWKTGDMEAVVRQQEKRAAAGATPMNDTEVQDYLIQRAAMNTVNQGELSESPSSPSARFDSDSPDPDARSPQKRPLASPANGSTAQGDDDAADLPSGSPQKGQTAARQERRLPASPTRGVHEHSESSVRALLLDSHSDPDSALRQPPSLDVTPPVAVFDHESPTKRKERSPNPLEVEVSGLREWIDPRRKLPERVDRGLEKYRQMDERQRAEIQLLAGLFTGWGNVYESSKAVWERMRADPDLDVEVLISQIGLSFAGFLVTAVRQFTQDEG
jgi:hypothetical protein